MCENKKYKIGFFMDDFYPSINGVNLVMDHCARALSEYCDFIFVVPYVEKNYIDNFPYKVIRVKGFKSKYLGFTWATPYLDKKFKQTIKNEHFDLIHIHSPFVMGRLGVRIAQKLNIPVVGTIHTQFKYDFDRYHLGKLIRMAPTKWLTKTFNLCNECFAVNEAIKNMYTSSGIKNIYSVIPNATDLKTSTNIEGDKIEINKKFNLNEEENVLLFVGRINECKNIFFILDSLKILVEQGVNFKMLFVGSIDKQKAFLKRIKKLNLENYIIICGLIYDRNLLQKIYARADLFLLPSFYDASSLVQIEAASQFTPTVFIENTSTASNIKSDYDGFITAFDKNTYASKIKEVLSNKTLLETVSKNCHDSLFKTWDDVGKILLEKYKKYLDK